MGPTWGPPGANRTQVGPMWTTWTLLSGTIRWIPKDKKSTLLFCFHKWYTPFSPLECGLLFWACHWALQGLLAGRVWWRFLRRPWGLGTRPGSDPRGHLVVGKMELLDYSMKITRKCHTRFVVSKNYINGKNLRVIPTEEVLVLRLFWHEPIITPWHGHMFHITGPLKRIHWPPVDSPHKRLIIQTWRFLVFNLA